MDKKAAYLRNSGMFSFIFNHTIIALSEKVRKSEVLKDIT